MRECNAASYIDSEVVEQIYYDEFSLSSRQFAFQNKANRGQQKFIEKKEESFSWSTIIAFCKKRIYGVESTIGTFTSTEIKGFYFHIFKSRFEDFQETEDIPVIIWYNASIHKSLEIREKSKIV